MLKHRDLWPGEVASTAEPLVLREIHHRWESIVAVLIDERERFCHLRGHFAAPWLRDRI
jgi:hypothetical protein